MIREHGFYYIQTYIKLRFPIICKAVIYECVYAYTKVKPKAFAFTWALKPFYKVYAVLSEILSKNKFETQKFLRSYKNCYKIMFIIYEFNIYDTVLKLLCRLQSKFSTYYLLTEVSIHNYLCNISDLVDNL